MSLITEPMEPAVFERAIKRLKAGQKFCYYLGALAQDRAEICRTSAFTNETVWLEPTHSLGLAAYAAWERGEVHLVQTKLAPDVYAYWAVKR